MNESLKVQPHHLERGAYLYVRQSSMRQVIENIESTKRQYALRGRAVALGWRDDQIIVIDNDQGESGASAAWRAGFPVPSPAEDSSPASPLVLIRRTKDLDPLGPKT